MPLRMNRSTRINKNASFRNLAKGFHALSRQILHFADQSLPRPHFQREISKMIIDFSGCDTVELWLKDRDKYFRCRGNRGSKTSSVFEIIPCAYDEKGQVIPGPDDDSNLAHLCRDIILGQADLALPGFKRSGSYWSGSIKRPHSLLLKRESKSSIRSLNTGGDYQSLVLIPLRINHQNVGLLQLKSKRKNHFSTDEIEFYENLAQTLGIALAHRHAQVDLRERVKELTCLYGIARLATQPNLSLKEILQGIVEVLPPAWLHPDIAHARIIVDEDPFSTSGFREGKDRQHADILINEKCRGSIEVAYAEERVELDEGPFLKEERNLLDAVAREVAIIIRRREIEDDRLRLREKLTRSEKMAALGQLSAGIAHEIRNPLTSVKIFIQSLEKEIDLDESQKEDFRIIKKEIDKINEHITRFLDFARPEDPSFQRVDIRGLLLETLNLLAPRMKSSSVDLNISLPKDLPSVEGDPKQLGQVFLNLILNAIEAMPKGGMLAIHSTVKVVPASHEELLQLFFRDTGCGIPEKDRPYLYDPFFSRKEKGTGLGLSIVYSIIQRHNGQIEVESELGKGSLFIISLPVSKEKTWKESSSSMTT